MTFSDLSVKLRNLSFCCSLLIVLHHVNATLVSKPALWNAGLHDYVCNQLSFWAVMFFFTMSGFWFARGHYVQDGDYWKFLRGKVKTLLVPYVMFALLGALSGVIVGPIYNVVVGKPLWARTVVGSASVWEAINGILGIVGEPKWNGPLWYVRALFIVSLGAPIWRWLVKSHRLFLVALWIMLVCVPCDCLSGEALNIRPEQSCYFLLGCFLGTLPVEKFTVNKVVAACLVVFWLVLSSVKSVGLVLQMELGAMGTVVQTLHFILAIPVAWIAYDLFQIGAWPLPEFVWGKAFFIYLAHTVLGGWLVLPLRFLLGKSDGASVILTPCSWLISVVGALFIARLLETRYNLIWRALTGGRSR